MQTLQTGLRKQVGYSNFMRLGNPQPSISKIFKSRNISEYKDGFSLVEIMLVLAIIAVLSSISLPAMRGFAASRRLNTSAQAIADTLTFARDMAITEKTTHLVVFNIDSNTYWLASSETFDMQNPIASAGRTSTPTRSIGEQTVVSRTGGIMGIPKQLNQGVTIASIVTTHNGVTQQIIAGADYVYFSPTSTSVDTIIYLRNVRDRVMSIAVDATTGRTSIQQLTNEQIHTLGLGNNL